MLDTLDDAPGNPNGPPPSNDTLVPKRTSRRLKTASCCSRPGRSAGLVVRVFGGLAVSRRSEKSFTLLRSALSEARLLRAEPAGDSYGFSHSRGPRGRCSGAGKIARSRLAGEPPEVVVAPRLARFRLLDYHRAKDAIEEGPRAMERVAHNLAVLNAQSS